MKVFLWGVCSCAFIRTFISFLRKRRISFPVILFGESCLKICSGFRDFLEVVCDRHVKSWNSWENIGICIVSVFLEDKNMISQKS